MMKFELEQESWMLEGACSSMDSDLFFPIGSSMKAMKQILRQGLDLDLVRALELEKRIAARLYR